MTKRVSDVRRRPRGFTLIEVLIAILVFSFGILGAVGMQARIIQMSTQNGDRSRASMLANEMASAMWGQQSTSVTAGAVQTYYQAWQNRVSNTVASGLPNGAGTVTVDASGVATITVTWRAVSAATTSTANKFVTTVVIP